MANNINATVAKTLGIVFVLIGLLGFVWQPLFGVFGVNLLHNLIHLLSGIALLALGYTNNGAYARIGNQVFGVVYLLVAILGFLRLDWFIQLLALDQGLIVADNILHTLLAIVFLAVGFGVRATGPTVARRA